MTDHEQKRENIEREALSSQQLDDIVGGATAIEYGLIASLKTKGKKPDAKTKKPDSHHHSDS